jgi:hypothetical protein
MSLSSRWHIPAQAQNIPGLWVTEGVRPILEISQMFSTICAQLPVWFLSKNAPVSKNPVKTPLVLSVNQSLPAT